MAKSLRTKHPVVVAVGLTLAVLTAVTGVIWLVLGDQILRDLVDDAGRSPELPGAWLAPNTRLVLDRGSTLLYVAGEGMLPRNERESIRRILSHERFTIIETSTDSGGEWWTVRDDGALSRHSSLDDLARHVGVEAAQIEQRLLPADRWFAGGK